MSTRRWRWKKTRIVVEAAIIGSLAALLIILFTETGVERQHRSVGSSVECRPNGV